MKIKVNDKGGEKDEIKVSLTARLSKVESNLTDLKSVLKWAKSHKVSLGEIKILLSKYDRFKEVIKGDYDDDFASFVGMIDNKLDEMSE